MHLQTSEKLNTFVNFSKNRSMTVIFTTDFGPICIKLFVEDFNDACKNFLENCYNGFYNDLEFHRIIPNYIIQTGDSSGTGIGGRSSHGASIDVLPSSNFTEPGIVAYAEKESVRSQIFITLNPQPEMNGIYCGFGKVVQGFNVVQSISRSPTFADNYPIKPIKIKSTDIVENPFHFD